MTTPALSAFLDLIAFSEGTSTSRLTQNDGYDVLVSGIDGPAIFTDYSDHPFAPQFNRPPVVVNHEGLISTAAGRYQLLYRYWVDYKASLGLTDYSPASQDAVALQQLKERGAIDFILAGNIQGAVEACSNIWASFPGNDYAQGGKTMGALLVRYDTIVQGTNV